jgi:hypothetical protein
LISVRILEDQLEIYNTSIDLVATHPLARGRHEKPIIDESHRPPSDHHEQLAMLREQYTQLGPVAVEYFEGLLRKCRNSRHEARRILSLLHGYPKQDGLAAIERGIQYHAYGYQSLERILAQVGTPKPNWELLSSREQEALQRITESTRVEARSSKDYQLLLDQQKDLPSHGQSPQTKPDCEPTAPEPSRDDLALPGNSETETQGGAA